MKRPLFSKTQELRESGADFAYFCSFSDLDRIEGRETLFTTESRPYFFMKDAKKALNEVIPELIRETGGNDARIPVFSSSNLVNETLGIKSRHENDWPMFGAILPSSTETGKFIRQEEINLNRDTRKASLPDNERDKLDNSIFEIAERIRDGEALQVVMSQRFDLEEFNGAEVLDYMLHNDRSRYVYYYKMGDKEIVGSSIENVFRKDGATITVNPIAGTRKRYSDTDQNLIKSLLEDNKELCEHRMLVDLARNDLSRIGKPGSVNVTRSMIPEKFYSVIHLTSSVEAQFSSDYTNYDVFASLFPAGTVSGAPKVRALELIDHYETRARGPYGGAIGVIGKDSMDMALTIRSAFMNRGKAHTQTGAGIVKDSVPEREIEEILAKTGTIMSGGLICA